MPPGAPTNVNADTDGGDILVSWDRPDSVFVDEYHVDQRQYNTQDWTRTAVAADQTSHRHAGPTPGTTYEYRVRTVNAGGVSEWTSAVTGVWYDTAAPPAQFIYTPIGTDRILVKWTASPTPDIQRYQLRHNVDGGDWTEVNVPKRKPYHFANWTTEQEYLEFQIRSRKDGQYGDWSPVSRAYVAVPDAVTSLTANLESSSGVRLHWEHPASGIPHTYRVQRLQDDGSYADIGVTAAGSRTTRSFLDTSGATSAYRVVAVNHAGLTGEHPESATATVTVPETVHVWPDMPRNLTIMMLDPGTVRLTWYAPAERANDVDAYRIYRKRADDNRGLGASYQGPRPGRPHRQRQHAPHRPHRATRRDLRVRRRRLLGRRLSPAGPDFQPGLRPAVGITGPDRRGSRHPGGTPHQSRRPDTPMAESRAYLNRWPRAAATLIDFAIYLGLVAAIAVGERGHPARVQPAGGPHLHPGRQRGLPRRYHPPFRRHPRPPGRPCPGGQPPHRGEALHRAVHRPGAAGSPGLAVCAHLHQRRPRNDQARPPAHLRPDHRRRRGQPTGDRSAERVRDRERPRQYSQCTIDTKNSGILGWSI